MSVATFGLLFRRLSGVLLLLLPLAEATALSMNEVAGGEMLLRTDKPGAYDPAIQLGTDVDIQVNGMVAVVSVRQQFMNPGADWVHGVYAFPLPERAAVDGMRIEVAGRVIIGEIKEKQAARKQYEAAKTQGKKAALVEQQRPNMFTSSVANIPPGESVTVTLTYTEKVDYSNGQFRLRFPMTITPRYMPGRTLESGLPSGDITIGAVGEHGWAMATGEVPDAPHISPWLESRQPTPAEPVNPVVVEVELNPGLALADVSSAYHAIDVRRRGDVYEVGLSQAGISMNKDFELTWIPTLSQMPQAAVFVERFEGEDYALVMVVPPEQQTSAEVIPRELILVVDRSGSMSGESIRQARQAVLEAISQLQPQDTFNVIQFDDSAQALFDTAQPAAEPWLSRAKDFVRRIDSGGGTEMSAAIELALPDVEMQLNGRLRQVVFVTDGAVGNEQALFELINRRLGNSRLFTVGIGSAPNSYFMREAAEFGRGTFTYIGKTSEVRNKMSALFALLKQPALRDIQLGWPADVEYFPSPVPDLYQGQPLVVTAKLKKLRGTLEVNGLTADQSWQQTLRLSSSVGESGIARLWARDKVAGLEKAIALEGETDELRQGILTLALRHQIMSRYTSFLAVEKQPSRPTGNEPKTKSVPNARPAGQGPQSFAYPQTATGMHVSLLLGLLSLYGWFLSRVVRRRVSK